METEHRSYTTRVINGTTTAKRVLIVDANFTLRIDILSITTQLPSLISNHSILIAVAGARSLSVTAALHAGLECADQENISLGGFGLIARGARAVGISTGVGFTRIKSLHLAPGDTGLAPGVEADNRSSVCLLRILGGRREAPGSNGAEIGAGAGNSAINCIAITNGQ
jgi:hypothetical protein